MVFLVTQKQKELTTLLIVDLIAYCHANLFYVGYLAKKSLGDLQKTYLETQTPLGAAKDGLRPNLDEHGVFRKPNQVDNKKFNLYFFFL